MKGRKWKERKGRENGEVREEGNGRDEKWKEKEKMKGKGGGRKREGRLEGEKWKGGKRENKEG